jgi:succinate dehydrogenase/fumarate reductase flavoprotein subunit
MNAARTRVIVCGGGMAGMTAAVSALQAGADVVLLEKAPEIGGSAAISGGLVWTFTDLDDLHRSVPMGNAVLQRLVHKNIDDARAWLASQGAVLGPEEPMLGHGRGRAIDPPQALSALQDRFLELGGTLLCETALEGLRTRDGRVVGVRAARADGSTVALDSDAVVLATGGFQGNPELLKRYLVDSTDNVYLRANPFSTGDALLAATDVGAAVTSGLDRFYGHAMAAPPTRFGTLNFTDVSQYHGCLSVALNLRGERFADESGGTGEEYLNQHLARQPEGRGFYIADQRVADMDAIPNFVRTRAILERAEARGAPMVVADTLEDLAIGLGDHGMPPSRVLATLQEFNAACEAGTTRLLSPPRVGRVNPLRHPPFVAVGVKAAITFTMGGLAVDERTRVLRRSATSSLIAQSITELQHYREVPIPGLFAAGCDVGNIHHEGYLGGLATGLTTGRAAGMAAAAVSGP